MLPPTPWEVCHWRSCSGPPKGSDHATFTGRQPVRPCRCCGLFYAVHCIDDTPLFVVTWYPLAASELVVVGASLGRAILR
ncbi:NrsF family protein [Aurantimonas sp. A2-1-M11]|uniref:NrsF family protein n=1 Tax=Aurantimonas sp. A2-1-M11 TaxID=3113712 RepID=UPI002F91FCF8